MKEINKTDKKSGVYIIINLRNGKVYVGATLQKIRHRWSKTKSSLRRNANLPNKHLQAAWNKYGEKNFIFAILENLEGQDEIFRRECYWIAVLCATNPLLGYNIVSGGFNLTIEDRKRLAEKHKKENLSPQTRHRLSEANRRRYRDPLERKKMGLAGKERIWSEESKKKISIALKGRKRSAEQIEKMRKNQLGKKLSAETKEKLSIALKGKEFHSSPEYRKKLSEAAKKAWRENKYERTLSTETKKKISLAHTGIRFSKERKRKISEGVKKWHQKSLLSQKRQKKQDNIDDEG